MTATVVDILKEGTRIDSYLGGVKISKACCSSVILVRHASEIHRLDQAGQDRALGHVQRVADIFAHIAAERSALFSRLQRIAEITQM